MMVDVYLRDGRTVLRFRSRGSFLVALKSDLLTIDERRPVKCWRAFEVVQHATGDVVRHPWEPSHCHKLAQGSVGNVMAVTPVERQAFELLFPDAGSVPGPPSSPSSPEHRPVG